jgi:hypothetical protein
LAEPKIFEAIVPNEIMCRLSQFPAVIGGNSSHLERSRLGAPKRAPQSPRLSEKRDETGEPNNRWTQTDKQAGRHCSSLAMIVGDCQPVCPAPDQGQIRTGRCYCQ